MTVHYTVFADNSSELCQKTGYTVSAINGIFTDEEDARNNQRFLKAELKDTYNGQKIDVKKLTINTFSTLLISPVWATLRCRLIKKFLIMRR